MRICVFAIQDKWDARREQAEKKHRFLEGSMVPYISQRERYSGRPSAWRQGGVRNLRKMRVQVCGVALAVGEQDHE